MPRKFVFSIAKKLTTYEQRVGSFHTTCKRCAKPAWQLTFRMYQVRGHNVMIAPEINESFQVRCSACGAAEPATHPSLWAAQLGVPYQQEQHAATAAIPAYSGAGVSRSGVTERWEVGAVRGGSPLRFTTVSLGMRGLAV